MLPMPAGMERSCVPHRDFPRRLNGHQTLENTATSRHGQPHAYRERLRQSDLFLGVDVCAVGATVVVPITLSLAVDCEDGCSADFSNTGLIGLSLPSRVSFTSASGEFLAASSFWMMMLIEGVGVLAGVVRRRKTR